MSYAEAIARVQELQARFGFDSYATTMVQTGTFDKVLQSAQNRFQRGPERINPQSAAVDPTFADKASATPLSGAGGRGAATSGLTEQLKATINRIARKHGVDPALVKAVARAESGFRSDAVSPAGAQGLMQLMPATGAGLGVKDPFDPEQSIEGGTRYLKNALKMFDGDVRLALAAYNAGPGAVKKYGGIPPYTETRNYVRKVIGFAREFGMRI
jgi:soluble lytic murein transglycosylase-like protein